MIRSAFGFFSGRSMTLPEGPVSLTSSPGLVSHRKFEQTPFLAGSSAFSSGHLVRVRIRVRVGVGVRVGIRVRVRVWG